MPRHATLRCLDPNGFHRIAYSEWGDPANPRVVICAHGLARNRRDFDFLARHLADAFRVVAFDAAGRGESDWLPVKEDYRFGQYLADGAALMARATAPASGVLARLARLFGIGRGASLDWVGTSMGGLVGMMLAARAGTPIRRLVLNDIGPLVPWSSLVRLKGYVGRATRFETMCEVEQWVREVCAPWGPLADAHVAHLARHGVRPDPAGGYVLHYDPDIVSGLRRRADVDLPIGDRYFEGVDLWPLWDAIRTPTLALRGGESDVLLAATAEEMKRRGPRAEVLELPGIGHAPALMAPEQMDAIRGFLLRA
ncbi:MAG: alpha/beta hydrolase [Burkholderiales bacterium]|nr:alpha/beta hydrolase [Burkholderiales bacterium]